MMKLKTIKTEAEYDAALARIDELMDAEPGSPEAEELELFVLLVEAYEAEHYVIDLPDPIEAIRFRMEQQGLTRQDMRPYLGSASKVSEVLNGKRTLSLTMIRKLHNGLGIPAEVLLQEPGRTVVGDCAYTSSEYPFNTMYKRGYFPSYRGPLRQAKDYAEDLLQDFFAVFGDRDPQPVCCRKTDKPIDNQALIAWQAQALRLALADDLPPLAPDALTPELARDVVRLSYLSRGPALVKEYLGRKGIHFVVLAHLPGTRLDGASFYSPQGRPVIGLTVRYDRLDNFWFTLAHELGHLCLHLDPSARENQVFFDEIDLRGHVDSSQLEAEVNRFAADALIPRHAWESDKEGLLDTDAIRRFADQLGISVAIVAGRVQWETGDYRRHRQLIGHRQVRCLFPEAFAEHEVIAS